VIGKDRFEYRTKFDATEIIEESLSKNGEPIYAIHKLEAEFSAQIRSATYSKEKLSEILRVECSDGEDHQNKLFLHRIGLAYLGLNADLKNVFRYIECGLLFELNKWSFPLPLSVKILASALGGDEEEALREITDVVRRLDIDITAIEIDQAELDPVEKNQRGGTKNDQKTSTKLKFSVTTTHKNVAGNPTFLDFNKHESDGTQRLAGLVGLILYVLKTGVVLLVDELEQSLHPLLMREIVLLFKKRSYNLKGAQLIFTTHNTDILDDSILRLSEIVLVKKTTANGTLVRRLVDAKKDGEDIRNVTNFRKQYLSGFYSGVPHPAL
jgi:AAA15 family ATPase/GTPase